MWDTRAAIPLGASQVQHLTVTLILCNLYVCVFLSLSLTVLLASSQAHEGKALCVDWLTGGAKDAQQGEGEGLNIVSGGSDCVLRSTPIATSSSQ